MRPPMVILAGGKGTRLGELTKNTPKPMLGIDGKPFLYHLIKDYRNQGFRNITISTGYKSEVIESYPWPEKWNLHFRRDSDYYNKDTIYKISRGIWVVNGDTYIPSWLPEVKGDESIIMVYYDQDAGAQFLGEGQITVSPAYRGFYDIGTLRGLERYSKDKTHGLFECGRG